MPADYLSVVSLGLGRTDEALKGLGEAFEERALHLPFLGVDPVFDSLRSEAKFTELLHKIGLALH